MSKFSKLIQNQKEQQTSKKYRFNLEAKTNANREGVLCACGSKKSYKLCCELIHKNIELAKTPLDLMKSRYTAYVLGDIDYLMLSHHSSTRPVSEKEEILNWTHSIEWKSLEIVESYKTLTDEGFVTFKAHFIEKGISNSIHEKSRFLKEDNHWTYIDGIHF